MDAAHSMGYIMVLIGMRKSKYSAVPEFITIHQGVSEKIKSSLDRQFKKLIKGIKLFSSVIATV